MKRRVRPVVGAIAFVAAGAALFAARPAAMGETQDAPRATLLQGHRAGVTGVAFAPDGEWVASSSLDGSVRIWTAAGGALEQEWRHGSEIYAVAIAPDGDLVAWSGADGRIVVAERGSEQPLNEVKLPDWSVAIAFAPDGTLVAAGTDRNLRWIDPIAGVVRKSVAAGSELLAVAVSADGKRIATGPPIKLWDFDTGKMVQGVAGHGQGGLAFAPDGGGLAAAEWVAGVSLFAGPGFARAGLLHLDMTITVLGRDGFAPITVNMPAAAVAFSPDGSTLAVAGTHREIPLHAVADGKVADSPRASLRGHTMTVTSVSFASDGKRLASGSLDGTVRIWELE